jgi:hypothetical protein
MYEGVVFCASDGVAMEVFEGVGAPFPMRLVRLAEGVCGVHRMARRSEMFDVERMTGLAARLSERCSWALAVFYDNRCGVRGAVLFQNGGGGVEFGEKDERWVLIDERGYPRGDVAPVGEEAMDPEQEYDCVLDGIEAGLAAMGILGVVDRHTLKQGFCYGESVTLAEAG